MFRHLIFVLALLIHSSVGFAPPSRAATFRPANFVSAAAPTSTRTPFVVLHMSGESSDEESTAVRAKISKDGTFYDDEMDSAPKKDGLSDSMKARLMKEASTGLDSDQKQANVLLYIILGVGVLVVLGGAGIFY